MTLSITTLSIMALTQISSIKGPDTTIKQTPAPMKTVPSKQRMKRSPQQDWKPFIPTTKRYTHIWSKPWPKLSKTYKGTRNSRNESQDHLEPSKQFKPWRRPLRPSLSTDAAGKLDVLGHDGDTLGGIQQNVTQHNNK
jgi:hypothetical protein